MTVRLKRVSMAKPVVRRFATDKLHNADTRKKIHDGDGRKLKGQQTLGKREKISVDRNC
jgi:hypothetical protein